MKQHQRVHGVLIGLLVSLVPASLLAAAASEAKHLLEPPDRSSPRATLNTLLDSIDEAWALYNANDPDFERAWEVASRSVDVSRYPPNVAPRLAEEAALMVKEILDRIEMPPAASIPSRDQVEAESLTTWTVPHTEIELVLLSEGAQAGQFVISATTVERIEEFYDRVRHLPYRAGKTGAHYDELRFGARSPLSRTFIALLPGWAKREMAGQLVWQWLGLALTILLSALLALTALRLGRKYTPPVAESRGWNRLWAFVFPLSLIFLAIVVRYLVLEQLMIRGAAGAYVTLASTAVAMVGGAWLTVVLVNRGAEYAIRLAAVERPLTQQLIRVSSRALALVLTLGWIFFGGQLLGIPVNALIAGLGVGGLAVALAAQNTVENLIGGISLYADQPVRIGDFLKLGDRIGFLEEVGLRSAKIRTLENTVITVPNSEFARLQLENLSRKTKNLLVSSLRLGYETTGDQLRYLVSKLTALLIEHPEILEENAQARLIGVGDDYFEIQLRAYASTADWEHFKLVRQDVLLKAITIVEEAGAVLAIPPRVLYTTEEGRVAPERAREAERRLAEWRESDKHLGSA